MVESRMHNDNPVLIYPNPAATCLSVEITMEEESAVSISILNPSGRAVGNNAVNLQLHPPFRVVELPVSDIKPGAYILRTVINGIVHADPFIIR
jgi:hypothetical protein